MSARARVFAVVGAAAVLVAGATAGVAWLQARGETTTAALHPRAGVPPLLFDFGLRNDAESKALANGAKLLRDGKRARAAAIFGRYHSLQAQLGAAFAKWPDLDDVESLAAHNPASPVAQLHLGLALVWAGRNTDGVKTLRQVQSRFPDSQSAVDAESVLYARDFPGLPYLIIPVSPPSASTLARQVQLAARAAKRGGAQAQLVYGVMLWRLDHRVSARRWLEAAARREPNPYTLTAAAVSAFTKRNPTAAFARLGPLTGRFPQAAVVRFHLGLLLLWTRQVQKGTEQLRLVVKSDPDSLYAKEATRLLSALVPNGTK
ncbi:MAG TPA: tetratricopeptide repeat protein [Gaiellaceae bacterium]